MTTDKCPICHHLMRIRGYGIRIRSGEPQDWQTYLACTVCGHVSIRKSTEYEANDARYSKRPDLNPNKNANK